MIFKYYHELTDFFQAYLVFSHLLQLSSYACQILCPTWAIVRFSKMALSYFTITLIDVDSSGTIPGSSNDFLDLELTNFPKICVSFIGQWYLETKIWCWGT